MKILFFGDINGKAGRRALAKVLPQVRSEHSPDLIVGNAENLAHGKGVTLSTFEEALRSGVDFFTMGNHGFSKPEVKEVFERWPDKLIRPANIPDTLPGIGFQIVRVKNQPVLMVNLLGQVFMEKQFDYGEISNPFLTLNRILQSEKDKAKICLVDFHAEATSEKRAMGFWADGRVSAVLGTHTHIPSADAQVLPQGTGYITDVGMTGAADSIIGVTVESAMKRFLADGTNMSERYPLKIDEGDKYEIDYAVLEIDEESGKCKSISNYRLVS